MQASLSPSGMDLPSERRISARSAAARNRSKIQRFKAGESAAFTCTPVSMFSQMRGGASTVVGPSSRRSRCTVSGLSGQLAQKPTTRLRNRVYAASPAHAIGRYARALSSAWMSSALLNASARASALACVSMTPFGLPVVPEGAGTLRAELAPELLDRLIGAKPVVLVVEHAARIVVDHQAEARELVAERQDLVDLLLVLGHDHRTLGVIPDERQLLGDRILEDRHRYAAQALRGHLRPVETRAVVADYRQPLASLEPERDEPEREVAHL